MSQQDKIYVPRSSAKQVTFRDGGSLLKLGFEAGSLIEFIKAHKNSRGYINFTVSKRRTPSQYGDTHSVSLDSFEPTRGSGRQHSQQPQPSGGKFDDVPGPVESERVPF